MMTDLQTIISIAKKVRKAMLAVTKKNHLTGYCGIASLALQKELNNTNINSTVWEGEFKGEGHAWVICEGYIVDITASQFSDMPDIYIAKAYARGCGYKPRYLMGSLEDFEDWEDWAKPTERTQRKINEAIRRQSILF